MGNDRVQLAGVDLRRGRLIAYSSSQTRDGFWVANGAFEILDSEVDDRVLGGAVNRMLDASRQGLRTPDLRRGRSPFAPVLDALGLRSHAAYSRGTRHVHVEREGLKFEVTPSRNGGSKEGFVGLAEQAVVLEGPQAEQLGGAVRAAMAAST